MVLGKWYLELSYIFIINEIVPQYILQYCILKYLITVQMFYQYYIFVYLRNIYYSLSSDIV